MIKIYNGFMESWIIALEFNKLSNNVNKLNQFNFMLLILKCILDLWNIMNYINKWFIQ